MIWCEPLRLGSHEKGRDGCRHRVKTPLGRFPAWVSSSPQLIPTASPPAKEHYCPRPSVPPSPNSIRGRPIPPGCSAARKSCAPEGLRSSEASRCGTSLIGATASHLLGTTAHGIPLNIHSQSTPHPVKNPFPPVFLRLFQMLTFHSSAGRSTPSGRSKRSLMEVGMVQMNRITPVPPCAHRASPRRHRDCSMAPAISLEVGRPYLHGQRGPGRVGQ